MVYQGPGVGTDVLDRPPDVITLDPPYTIPNPEKEKDKLGRAKSSLTIVENPSLDGLLTILMASNTILGEGRTGFIEVYIITANEDYKYLGVDRYQLAAIEESRDPESPHTLILGESNKKHPVGSEHPYRVCKISDDIFNKLQADLMLYESTDEEPEDDDSDDGIDAVVRKMVHLIVEEFPDDFSIDEDGKLVLPNDYANTPLNS